MISIEQLKAHIRNKSRSLNVNPNIILRNVIFDFFLEKLGKSKYADKFIIKGGFLVSAFTRIDARTTMDLDVTIKNLSIQKEKLTIYLNEILRIPTHDNLVMNLTGVEKINEGFEYPGLRASITVHIDGLREIMKIDITAGDVITPNEICFKYQTLLDEKFIELRAYNIETVIAEKIETILSRGILNTRMRDFYDIYILKQLKLPMIHMDTLRKAFINTASHRKTLDMIMLNYRDIITMIENDEGMKKHWKSYQSSYTFANDLEWSVVVESVKSIFSYMST